MPERDSCFLHTGARTKGNKRDKCCSMPIKPLSYLSFSLLRYLSAAVFFLDLHNMLLFIGYTGFIINHVVKQIIELYVFLFFIHSFEEKQVRYTVLHLN